MDNNFHLFWLPPTGVYEWPNQGSDRGRRADLVGLNRQGGLVVFEGKVGNNSYGPFAAALEGLDYLACLTSASNLVKVQDGFARWRSKPATAVPEEFRDVSPTGTARHEVIVLAPTNYYGLYSRSDRGTRWPSFASLPSASSVLSIRFEDVKEAQRELNAEASRTATRVASSPAGRKAVANRIDHSGLVSA